MIEMLMLTTAKIAAEFTAVKYLGVISVKKIVIGKTEPRAKLGAVVATVALRFVPNYSAAIVAKIVA